MYIGHLSIFHKGSKPTRCTLCKEEINIGQTYFLFRKKIKKKFWLNQGLHLGCISWWLARIVPVFEAREDGRKNNRPVVSGRPPVKFNKDVTEDDRIERRRLMVRKAHLMRRLRQLGTSEDKLETRRALITEMKELEKRIRIYGEYNTKYAVEPRNATISRLWKGANK